MSGISFDDDALRRLGQEAGQAFIAQVQPALDAFAADHAGEPVDQVKPALAAMWHRETDGELTDPDLTGYAERISAGESITLRLGPTQL